MVSRFRNEDSYANSSGELMKILLTGGTGYIGSHTAVALALAGHELVLLDNLCNSEQTVITRLEQLTGKSIRFIEADVRNTAKVRDTLVAHQIEAVMHFAGLKAVADSVTAPVTYYSNNVSGTLSLLDAMTQAKVYTLIFSSSATVYGNPVYLPMDEHHPVQPLSPYGRTKLHVEQILGDAAIANPDWHIACLRYFNPAGAHPSGLIGENPHGVPNNLMPYIGRTAAGKLSNLSIFGNDYNTHDGTAIRDYIHIMDLAEGHCASLDFLVGNNTGLHIFNLGTGRGYSVLEVLSAFEKAVGQTIPHQFTVRRTGDSASYYADASKAEKILGWKTHRSLQDICATAWRFQCNETAH